MNKPKFSTFWQKGHRVRWRRHEYSKQDVYKIAGMRCDGFAQLGTNLAQFVQWVGKCKNCGTKFEVWNDSPDFIEIGDCFMQLDGIPKCVDIIIRDVIE